MAKEDQEIIDGYIAACQSARIMMRQVSNLPRLNKTQEKELAVRARKGDEKSRNRLAVSLLHRAVRQATRKYHGIDLEDRIQDGAVALLENVARTHPSHLDLPIRRRITEDVALMYKPYSIPYHMISVLGCLSRIWEQKAQELKRLPREEDLIDDLERKIKRMGNFNVRENIHLWTKMLDLPLSSDQVGETIPSPKTVIGDKEPVIKKLQTIFASHECKDDFKAAKVTLGINDGEEQTQCQAAKTLGVSQRTVSTRVGNFKKQLAGNPRVFALYKELRDLEEEDFY